jgi:hypothetical protein
MNLLKIIVLTLFLASLTPSVGATLNHIYVNPYDGAYIHDQYGGVYSAVNPYFNYDYPSGGWLNVTKTGYEPMNKSVYGGDVYFNLIPNPTLLVERMSGEGSVTIKKNGAYFDTLITSESAILLEYTNGSSYSVISNPSQGYSLDKVCFDINCNTKTNASNYTATLTSSDVNLYVYFKSAIYLTVVSTTAIDLSNNALGVTVVSTGAGSFIIDYDGVSAYTIQKASDGSTYRMLSGVPTGTHTVCAYEVSDYANRRCSTVVIHAAPTPTAQPTAIPGVTVTPTPAPTPDNTVSALLVQRMSGYGTVDIYKNGVYNSTLVTNETAILIPFSMGDTYNIVTNPASGYVIDKICLDFACNTAVTSPGYYGQINKNTTELYVYFKSPIYLSIVETKITSVSNNSMGVIITTTGNGTYNITLNGAYYTNKTVISDIQTYLYITNLGNGAHEVCAVNVNDTSNIKCKSASLYNQNPVSTPQQTATPGTLNVDESTRSLGNIITNGFNSGLFLGELISSWVPLGARLFIAVIVVMLAAWYGRAKDGEQSTSILYSVLSFGGMAAIGWIPGWIVLSLILMGGIAAIILYSTRGNNVSQ